MALLWLKKRLRLSEIELKTLGIPEPEEVVKDNIPIIVREEQNFDKHEEQTKTLEKIETMNDEQHRFFESVMHSVNSDEGGIFFLDAIHIIFSLAF